MIKNGNKEEDDLSFDFIRVQKFRVGLGQPKRKVDEKILTIDEAMNEEIVMSDYVLRRLEEDGFYSDAVGQGLRGNYTPFREGDEFCISVGTSKSDEIIKNISKEIRDDDIDIEVNENVGEICGNADSFKEVKKLIDRHHSFNDESYKLLAKKIKNYVRVFD